MVKPVPCYAIQIFPFSVIDCKSNEILKKLKEYTYTVQNGARDMKTRLRRPNSAKLLLILITRPDIYVIFCLFSYEKNISFKCDDLYPEEW